MVFYRKYNPPTVSPTLTFEYFIFVCRHTYTWMYTNIDRYANLIHENQSSSSEIPQISFSESNIREGERESEQYCNNLRFHLFYNRFKLRSTLLFPRHWHCVAPTLRHWPMHLRLLFVIRFQMNFQFFKRIKYHKIFIFNFYFFFRTVVVP